jgi:hypothetical protein
MKRILTMVVVAVAVVFATAILRSSGKAETSSIEAEGREKWEYLIVAGPSNANFTPTGNPKMRKVEGTFGREAFVMEAHFDKLGAEGWQLVSVSGEIKDPVFYFKRLRASQ